MPIGTILSTIFSKAASSVVDSVGNAFDKNFTSKEEKEAAKLELQKEINRSIEAIQAEATNVYESELKDIQSARDANVRIQESDKASWWAKNTAYFLDVFIGLVWGSITIFIAGKALKLVGSNMDMTGILSLYSTVTAVFMICLNFHRGTSAGSAAKQKQLDKMINEK